MSKKILGTCLFLALSGFGVSGAQASLIQLDFGPAGLRLATGGDAQGAGQTLPAGRPATRFDGVRNTDAFGVMQRDYANPPVEST